MTEGADEIAPTGSHVIKLWLSPDTRWAYGVNASWPAYTNMVDTVVERCDEPVQRLLASEAGRHVPGGLVVLPGCLHE